VHTSWSWAETGSCRPVRTVRHLPPPRIENQILPVPVCPAPAIPVSGNIGTLLNISHELSLNVRYPAPRRDVVVSGSMITTTPGPKARGAAVLPGTILQGTGSMFQIKKGSCTARLRHQF